MVVYKESQLQQVFRHNHNNIKLELKSIIKQHLTIHNFTTIIITFILISSMAFGLIYVVEHPDRFSTIYQYHNNISNNNIIIDIINNLITK